MIAQDFKKTIDTLSGPILVIVQAGHINSGGFDPFEDIIPLAHAKGAWVHVDGAFGLWQGGEIIRISVIAHGTEQHNAKLTADRIIAAWRKIRDQ